MVHTCSEWGRQVRNPVRSIASWEEEEEEERGGASVTIISNITITHPSLQRFVSDPGEWHIVKEHSLNYELLRRTTKA